jgi:hypothetical protein
MNSVIDQRAGKEPTEFGYWIFSRLLVASGAALTAITFNYILV